MLAWKSVEDWRSGVVNLVASNPEVVNFGGLDDYVGDDWIVKSEEWIGCSFPDSYRWFLKNFGGGEIAGDEIFSVYGVPFESANGGDIIYQSLIGRRGGLVASDELVVSRTDHGEVFYFKVDRGMGEWPIFLKLPSGNDILYASNFYEFLVKRIEMCV